MLKQIEIDFTVHLLENAISSQLHLDENRERFSKQCRKVFNLLMEGKELTVLGAITDYQIHSLPRRILDLKTNGVLISDKWNESKTKTWFLDEAQKEFNRKFI